MITKRLIRVRRKSWKLPKEQDPQSQGRFRSLTEKNVYTILRSPHVNKDSREQFEMRIHKRLIDILDPSKKTADALMRLELPAGVSIEIKV